MKVHANRRGCEARADGNLGARHPLHESEHERFPIRVRERADDRQHGQRLGPIGIDRSSHGFGQLHRLRHTAQMIGCAIARDGGQPAAKGLRLPERSEPLHGGHEDVLHEIFDLCPRHAGQQNAVNAAPVLRIKLPKRLAAAALRGPDQSNEVEASKVVSHAAVKRTDAGMMASVNTGPRCRVPHSPCALSSRRAYNPASMPGASYRFGPFLGDRTSYRVLRGTEPLALTPKLLDLLFHLLDHPGTLITKEELFDALWPGANVTENALAQAVSELRQALGDDAAAPQFIKTVARRGYRFIAAVESVDSRQATASDAAATQADGADVRTIAVMDFANVSGDTDGAWLSAGIAETVTCDLRALGDFHVVDRWRVVEAARRTDGSLHQVAADLRARLMVVGSYQRNGGHVRITARVVDVISGEALADAKVDGPLDGIFALQDQVVAQFASELGFPHASTAAVRPRVRETASLDAHRAFSEGWLRLESLDIREIPQAIADFERAVAADSRYALAYTGLATAQLARYETTRSDNQPDQDLLQRAAQHARHAVHLDDRLGEAHATLALVLVSLWQTDAAAASARRAVALEPSNWRHLFRLGHATWGDQRLRAAARMLDLYPDFAFAHFQIAMVHVACNHLREAEAVLRQGAAVQDRQIARGGRYPALGLHWLLGLVRLAQEDLDEAMDELDRELRLAEPSRLYGREFAMYALHGRGAALLRKKLPDAAIDSFHRALALYPHHGPSHLGLALAHRANGSTAAATEAFAGVEEAIATLTHARPVEAAIVRSQWLAARGEDEEAIASLDHLLDEAPPGFAAWTAPVEPFLQQLNLNKRFAAVLGRLAERAK